MKIDRSAVLEITAVLLVVGLLGVGFLLKRSQRRLSAGEVHQDEKALNITKDGLLGLTNAALSSAKKSADYSATDTHRLIEQQRADAVKAAKRNMAEKSGVFDSVKETLAEQKKALEKRREERRTDDIEKEVEFLALRRAAEKQREEWGRKKDLENR